MQTDDNRRSAVRFIEEVFERGSHAAVDERVADEFVSHAWPSSGPGNGRADLHAAIDRLGGALADVRFTVEDTIAEADRVAVRLTAEARQVGPFMGLPASGRSYRIGEIHVLRTRDGRVVEHWDQVDQLGMLHQLGALPEPG